LELESNEKFWVFYVPGYEFLLREEIYSKIIESNIMERFEENQLFQIQNEELQLIEIKPLEDKFPETIW
jgi:hypothetical protein